MFGTIVNVGAIVAGSLIGGLFRRVMNEKLSASLMSVMGLAAFGLGINAVVQNMPKSAYSQRCLFWIFTAASSMLWSYMVSYILHDITNDWIWGIFLGLAAGGITLAFHMAARARYYG